MGVVMVAIDDGERSVCMGPSRASRCGLRKNEGSQEKPHANRVSAVQK